MRARDSWLALALTCLLCGCMSPRDRAPAPDPGSVLDPVQAGLSEALAHYSQALIDEATPGAQNLSLEHWRAAVQGDPTNVALRLKLGAVLLQRKESAEAIRVLTRARALDDRSPDIRLLLGSALQMSGQSRAAAREYRALIRLAPDHPDGYVRLAGLYLVRGQPARAMRVIDDGLTHAPARVAILQYCESLGRLHLVNGRFAEAVGYFERIRDRIPDSLPLRDVLARCYVLAGERAKATAELEELLRRDPRNGPAAFLLGELYEEAGNLDRAEACFEQATRNKPSGAEPFLRLAMLQLSRHRDRALATLQRAVATVPDDPLIQAYLGLVYSRGGKFDLAAEAFGRAEALVGKDGGKRLQPSFYFWYGTACERAGRFEQAEPLLETCIAADPLADNALNYLAYMWAERGIKLDKALDYITRALKISPDEGAYVDTLGWVQYKRGEYAAALKTLRRALELTPDDPTIPEHLGDTLQALGRPREARRYWLKSLKAEPDNAALRAKLRGAGMDPDAPSKPEP